MNDQIRSVNQSERTRSPINIPFHPIFFSIYPILALYIQNFFLVSFGEFLVILLINFTLMVLLWFGINRLTKNINKSAVIVSAFFVLFFSFGHFLPALTNFLQRFFGSNIKPLILNNVTNWNLILLSAWLMLFILFIVLTFKSKSEFRLVTGMMNVISLTLVIFGTFQAAQKTIQFRNMVTDDNQGNNFAMEPLNKDAITEDLSNLDNLPDIYYIILDGYAGYQTLRDYYNYDNHEIKQYLQDKNFYIAEGSHSNYTFTVLSLASSLNLDYLDDVAKVVGKSSNNAVPVVKMLKSNRLSRFLGDLGYQTIAFESGYGATDLTSSDIFINPSMNLTQFQNQLINLTPLRILLIKSQYNIHRNRILNIMNQLPDVKNTDGPAFIFAHIIAPHPPFAFGADGEFDYLDIEFTLSDGSNLTEIISTEEYQDRYRNQVIYLNSLLKETIDEIFSADDRPKIIIIQADHGPGSMLDWYSIQNSDFTERTSIFNAYYFPDQNYSNLYPDITPVNTFRIILDQYFGLELETLEDKSYFSIMTAPYDFLDVTGEVKSEN